MYEYMYVTKSILLWSIKITNCSERILYKSMNTEYSSNIIQKQISAEYEYNYVINKWYKLYNRWKDINFSKHIFFVSFVHFELVIVSIECVCVRAPVVCIVYTYNLRRNTYSKSLLCYRWCSMGRAWNKADNKIAGKFYCMGSNLFSGSFRI